MMTLCLELMQCLIPLNADLWKSPGPILVCYPLRFAPLGRTLRRPQVGYTHTRKNHSSNWSISDDDRQLNVNHYRSGP